MGSMNRISRDRRIQILTALVEGNSIASPHDWRCQEHMATVTRVTDSHYAEVVVASEKDWPAARGRPDPRGRIVGVPGFACICL